MNFSFNSGKSSSPSAEPLRILILGPFHAHSASELLSARINSDNFDQVLGMFDVNLTFSVANFISSVGKQIDIQLTMQCLSDYHPLSLIESIPQLRELYDLLQLCQQYQFRRIDEASFHNRIQAFQHLDSHQIKKSSAPPPVENKPQTTASTSDTQIDRLFDMVDLPEEVKQEDSAASLNTALTTGLDQLIVDLVGDGARQNISAFVKQCQERLRLQLDAILHHVEFQKSESLWRGIRCFVDQVDFRSEIYVDLIACAENIDSQIIAKLNTRLDNEEFPYTCIFYAREFTNAPAELTLLEELGQFADQQQTPLVTALSPYFFACSDFRQLKNAHSLFNQGNFDKYNSIREKDFSRWLCLCFNPFLARNAYDINKKNKLEYKESYVHGDYVWANPIWLMASGLANSTKTVFWPSKVTGVNSAIDHLPVSTEHALNPFSPLLYDMPLNIAEELADLGVNSLVGITQRDSAFFPYARCLFVAPHYSDNHANQVSKAMTSLPYLLLLRQIINNILVFKSRTSGESAQESDWQAYLEQLLSTTGPGYDVLCRIEQHHGQNQIKLDLVAGDNVGHFPAFQFSFSL